FEAAIRTFSEAAQLADGSPKYELERIVIESKFFDVHGNSAETLIPELEDLYDRIQKETATLDSRLAQSRIAGTFGNVLLQIGNEHRLKGENDKAAPKFERAWNIYDSAPIKDKWIAFGKAECLYRLGRSDEAAKILNEDVYDSASTE